MAKEFKDWDKKFSAAELRAERAKWLDNDEYTKRAVQTTWRWIHKIDIWTQDFVQHCVYKASDAEDWQRFRVSLKGCTTAEKLYMLNRWRVHHYIRAKLLEESKINMCRVDNYLGALRRGGQLNERYEIVK